MQEQLRSTDLIVRTITPAMKTFPTNEIAIIGCHAGTMARHSCEYDLLVIDRDPIPEKVIGVGDSFARLTFRNEFEVREPKPELAVALAKAIPLRDNSLLLASAVSDSVRNFSSNCSVLTESHLAASLKALGRVDELLLAKETREADFWLLSAAYHFAFAELLSYEVIPSPSHLLSQMKGLPRRDGERATRGSSFESWAGGAGLELASKTSCENRLEALSVVYDVLKTSAMSTETLPEIGRYQDPDAFTIVRLKTTELVNSMQSVECFSFLGWETIRSIVDLYSLHAVRLSISKDYISTIRDLTVGKDRLISEEVLKSLGLVRSIEILESASASLKTSVNALAKKM